MYISTILKFKITKKKYMLHKIKTEHTEDNKHKLILSVP